MTMTFKDLEWIGLRPTQEEAEATLCGVRAAQYGVRMEVRIVNTITHGVHISWTVCSRDHLLMVTGQIPLTPGLVVIMAFNEGKQRAIKFGELWISMVL